MLRRAELSDLGGGSLPSCSAFREGGSDGLYHCSGRGSCPRYNRGCWGNDNGDGMFVFTGDSSPCRAARFVGAIGDDGGTYFIEGGRPGLASYSGGVNGRGERIASWGSYPNSFVVRTEDGALPSVVVSASAAATSTTAAAAAGGGGGGVEKSCREYQTDSCSGLYRCPGRTCVKFSSYVWGGPESSAAAQHGCVFTGDSSICGAARAAGIISTEGGRFCLRPVGARSGLQGFEANGVNVRSWRSYSSCFVVLEDPENARHDAVAQQQTKHTSKAVKAEKSKKQKLFFAFEDEPIIG